MSTGSTWLRGIWIFQPETVPAYKQDLRYSGQLEQAVQAIGGVAIVMEPCRLQSNTECMYWTGEVAGGFHRHVE
jgi:hypothetical protein